MTIYSYIYNGSNATEPPTEDVSYSETVHLVGLCSPGNTE